MFFATDSTGGREAGGFITTAVKQEGGGALTQEQGQTDTQRAPFPAPHTAPGGGFGVCGGGNV